MNQTGKATLFGTFDEVTAPTITFQELGGVSPSARKIIAMSVELEMGATIDDVDDENGEITGFNRRKQIRTLTGEFVVRADNRANSRLAILPPADLTKIVLANYISSTHTLLNGDWVYKTGAKVSIKTDDEAKLSIVMYQFPSSTLTATQLVAAIS